MKKIKFMYEYKCFPLWLYDNKDELIGCELPEELKTDINLKRLLESLQDEYDALFIDNEIEFDFVGFKNTTDRQSFIDKTTEAISILRDKLDKLYIITISIHI